MTTSHEFEYPTISREAIEAGVRRGHELRARYFRELGRRVINALRGTHRAEHGHDHGDMLPHGC